LARASSAGKVAGSTDARTSRSTVGSADSTENLRSTVTGTWGAPAVGHPPVMSSPDPRRPVRWSAVPRHELLRLDKMIAQLESMNTGGAEGVYDAAREMVPEIAPKDIENLSHAEAAIIILSRASSPMTIRQILEVFGRA
jgi:hypothetical protein